MSPLIDLNGFDLVEGFAVDYMHCVFLGVVGLFTNKWIKKPRSLGYIGSQTSLIDELLMKTKVPNEIVRATRSIDNMKFWKASEWRTFLLLIPVLLKGILPDPYLNHFNHLSKGIYLLSQSKLSTRDMRIGEKSLGKFLKGGN